MIPPGLGTRHGDVGTRHGDVGTRHGDVGTRHGDVGTRHGDVGTRHGDLDSRKGDRGSGSIWLLTLAALVLLVAVGTILRVDAVLVRHRAESAADLSALAAAGRIGVSGDPCAAAAVVATANGARLQTCAARLAADGRSGMVDVRVDVAIRLPGWGAGTVTASARAGRLPAQAG